jgi:hypothetical protein
MCRLSYPGARACSGADLTVAGRARQSHAQAPIEALIAALTADELREIVSAAVDDHGDVESHVRLIAARAEAGLAQLRAEVDCGLRTRRFLSYRETGAWARSARPIVAELDTAVDEAPSPELVELLQRAVGHVVKVIHHADDSNGTIGDLARHLLGLHARACDAGVADPVKLAKWMVKFRFTDQDFFEADPVRYAGALGEVGLAAYRSAVAEYDGADSFAVRYARERLAILDGDVEQIVSQLGGDLSTPYHFIRIAEAMAELGLHDEVLVWATRGIERTSGWQVAQLYGLASAAHTHREEPLEVLALRRMQHERMPSTSTYRLLRDAAEALDAWPVEQGAARATLQQADVRAFVEVLLGDGETELAWSIAAVAARGAVGSDLWLRLAEAREPEHPADALPVYERLADEQLERAERRAYRSAAWLLKRSQAAAQAAGISNEFGEHLARLRDQHRRRPSLIAILDKAGLR